jgi:hypothetical protein
LRPHPFDHALKCCDSRGQLVPIDLEAADLLGQIATLEPGEESDHEGDEGEEHLEAGAYTLPQRAGGGLF